MTDIRLQFKQAAKALCNPCATSSESGGSTKSYAQVETLVLPPKSGGLKPGSTRKRTRTTPFAVRLSEQQKAIIRAKAKAANCNVNEYIRVAVLGANQVAYIDPVKRQLLLDAYRELTRQGNNLNQIARQLNAGIITPHQAENALAVLAEPLMAAYQAILAALAEGRSAD